MTSHRAGHRLRIGNVAFQALGLRVTAATLRIVTPSPLAAGEVSVSYSVAFQSDGRARPLVWEHIRPLPAGITFDATGLLSGTPTAPGDFVFTVRVSDSTGATANAPYEVLVRPFGPDLLCQRAAWHSQLFAMPRLRLSRPSQSFSTMHDSIPFTASADVPWITTAASGATPGRIDISVDPTGLTRGSYAGTITVSSPNRTALSRQGGSHGQRRARHLTGFPCSAGFLQRRDERVTKPEHLCPQQRPGSLNFTVSTNMPWLSVSPTSGTVSPNPGAILVAAIDTAERLTPGVLSGNIEIDSAKVGPYEFQ